MSALGFRLEDGMRMQAYQLKWWKLILTKRAYGYLVAHVERLNKKLKPRSDGYDVARGCAITEYVTELPLRFERESDEPTLIRKKKKGKR